MRVRRILAFFMLLLTAAAVTACAESAEESPYAAYMIPWERDVSQIAAENGDLHFYFMSGEGMLIDENNDQGQTEKWGDACLVVFPNGETMLIDSAVALYTPILMENLKRLGVEKLDYILISHPHGDHYGGFFAPEGVLFSMPVGQAFCNGYNTASFSGYLSSEDVPLRTLLTGDVLEIGGVKLQVLSPDQEQLDNPTSDDPVVDANDASLVLRMDYNEFSALFTGDIYTSEERRLVKEYEGTGLLDVDMLKLPHHGDTTSSSSAFADAVKPQLGVATGAIPLDFPLYLRYAQYGDTILHDYLDGYVHVYTDGETLQWETSRERQTNAYDAYDAYYVE